MPTKNEIKFISALKQKKHRNEHGLFVAEGEKLILHFLKNDLKPTFLYATPAFYHEGFLQVSVAVMQKLSFLSTPSAAFAVFKKPQFEQTKPNAPFLLVLDGVRDPGNMGTILRLCDWFGLNQIICTEDCVDVFNEKVVQASMGSVAATQVFVKRRNEIAALIFENNYAVFGADMNATPMYEVTYTAKSALILGNEGQGISDELAKLVSKKISIPAAQTATAESLNVAMAAAILISDYARKKQ